MGKLSYVIIVLAGLLTFSCVCTKNVKSDETTTTENMKSDSVTYFRFIVSFYSPGNGVDHKMKQKYVEFITKNYPNIIIEKTKWGKEGEIDFCFQLNELEENRKQQFVKESKELLSSSSRVHIYENAPCKHDKSR
jgi:hypothetical protein